MSNNHTPPGFNGDDGDEPDADLTPAQLAARDAAWPEFAGETAENVSGWPESEAVSEMEPLRRAA